VTEEKRFPRKKAAKLMRVNDLTAETENPVRVLGIVIDSSQGAALIQDIYDDSENQGKITVLVEGTLEVAKKFLFIGDIAEKSVKGGKELQLAASIAHNIDALDIKLYRETLAMEESVIQTLTR
jgi:hypothetical protein